MCIKTWLLIFFVSYITHLPVSAKPIKKDCYGQFNNISVSEIQKIFSKPESWTKYQGQEGYLLFTKKSPNITSMNYLFRLVSKALGTKFKQLGWQQYQGLVKDFLDERNQILDEKANPKQEYLGMDGYAEYAKQYHGGEMIKAFNNVSAVLDKITFQQLGWQQYQGLVKDFLDERNQILDEKANPKQEYLGMEGYAEYAKQYHENNMEKTFKNVSAVLGGYWGMKELSLKWKQFQGSVSEYYNLLQLFKDHPSTAFKGLEGQRRVAEEIFQGHFKRTYKNVSTLRVVLLGSRKAFTDLHWSASLK